ncbi:MAG: alpha/beta hydrolase [Chloroflexota bacterium]|nr:MAG: alpha/beta hydrolase [Chloroflexota bacterium]
MKETIIQRIQKFSDNYGKDLSVEGVKWRYYRLGQGPVLLFLTGGLRRAAFGFGFMECLSSNYTVIAPDYPPLMTIGEMVQGLEAILDREAVADFHLLGQSYGGMLAQGLMVRRPQCVQRLVLSSTGPADYTPVWARVDDFFIFLVRLLPEGTVKRIFGGGLMKLFSFRESEREDWEDALRDTIQNDLTRADFVSHFAVAADLIRKRIVRPEAYQAWTGRPVVLSAENDRTQGKDDQARLEALFKRPVEMVSMGNLGHTAIVNDPARYSELLLRALT